MIGPFKGQYLFLSNFYPSPIRYRGIIYPTVEHYYQAQKLDKCDELNHMRILGATNAADAKRIGRSVPMKPGFEEVKRAVMLHGLMFKFCQNLDLREKLLNTGNQHLEEVNDWGDRYWGTVNGEGENWLGKLLMITREALS